MIFSVIIPGFNRVEPLRHTLRSAAAALDRLPGDGEIILVDDGSTPALAEQLADFPADHRLRHLRQANQGSIVARQTGLAAARGEFVLFLDSDDLIHSEKLRQHLEAFGAAPGADVVYDDMAVARIGPGDTVEFFPGAVLPVTADPLDWLLRLQPAPHNPTYRRSYLNRVLAVPTVPGRRAFDPSGDVWLYYNLLLQPPALRKVNAALTAPGPHEEARYSQHWEKLGVAALLLAEDFMRRCPATSATAAARQAVGEAAFHSWRRLPSDFDADYTARTLALWQAAPHGSARRLGGGLFTALATVLGIESAGRLLRRRNAPYRASRTLADADLQRLLASSRP